MVQRISTTERRVAGTLAWVLLAGIGLGCATPGLPPGEAASSVTAETIRRTQDLYLHPDRMDRRMMTGALDRLESRFDAVRFDEGDDGGVLWVGSARAYVPLDGSLEPERFQEALGRALSFVEQHLDEEITEDEDLDLEMLALQGALGALDRYSTIFSGQSTENFEIRFSGKLKGIGSRIGRRDGQLIAIKVFPGSPAEKAGLRDGDAMLYIDGDPTQPLTVSEAVGRIRGEAGSSLTLGILREDEQMDITIVRGEVRIPTVEARLLENGFGYAAIEAMSRSTVKEFREKVLGLGELSGLVLDLRGNTGGSMSTATRLADLFLAHRTIVRVVDRKDPESRSPRSRSRARPNVLFHLPVIVLVDPATASAAEIVSGALAPLPQVQLVGPTRSSSSSRWPSTCSPKTASSTRRASSPTSRSSPSPRRGSGGWPASSRTRCPTCASPARMTPSPSTLPRRCCKSLPRRHSQNCATWPEDASRNISKRWASRG
jgi:C-terminal peptidase prc